MTFSGDPASYGYGLYGNKPVAALLPNGKVLLVGLTGPSSLILNLATNTIEYAPRPTIDTNERSLALLPNGKVLYMSGLGRRDGSPEPKSVEFFDPETNSWRSTTIPAINGAAVLAGRLVGLLPNGKVLSLLYTQQGETVTQMSASYDPQMESWAEYAPLNAAGFLYAHAVTLANGQVLTFANNQIPELYDPVQVRWRSIFPAFTTQLPPLLLADGRVFTGKELFGFHFGAGLPTSLVSASAASFRAEPLAKNSLATVFGANLNAASGVSIKDPQGHEYPTKILSGAPSQINYEVPAGPAAGQAEMTIRKANNDEIARGLISIVNVAPGLFTANADGRGVPAAVAQRVKADGLISYEAVARFDSAQNRFVPAPIDLSAAGDDVFLVLFGTGVRNRRALTDVQIYVGDVKAEVSFAGAQSDFAGLDQLNVRLPRSLAGRGEVDVYVTVDGKTANPVKLQIK